MGGWGMLLTGGGGLPVIHLPVIKACMLMLCDGLVPLFTSAHCASTPFLVYTYTTLLYSTLTYPRCGAG